MEKQLALVESRKMKEEAKELFAELDKACKIGEKHDWIIMVREKIA